MVEHLPEKEPENMVEFAAAMAGTYRSNFR
jgi:hypothetical protein